MSMEHHFSNPAQSSSPLAKNGVTPIQAVGTLPPLTEPTITHCTSQKHDFNT